MSLLACLEVTIQRIGVLVASFVRQGGRLAVSFSRIGGMTCAFSRVDSQLTATTARVGTMTCTFGLVCSTSIGDEAVLWASDGIVFNVLGEKIYITKKS